MTISRVLRFRVLERDLFACRYCGRKAGDVVLEVDHIVPVALGGRSRTDNLIAACFACNRGKRDRMMSAEAVEAITPAVIERVVRARAPRRLRPRRLVLVTAPVRRCEWCGESYDEDGDNCSCERRRREAAEAVHCLSCDVVLDYDEEFAGRELCAECTPPLCDSCGDYLEADDEDECATCRAS